MQKIRLEYILYFYSINSNLFYAFVKIYKFKLWELGKLCGLLPGTPDPSSAQLHLVVTLSAGMMDVEFNNSPQDSISITPIDKLKEALGSKQAFQTHYLELAELAMGTYKHIGRLRFNIF